MQLEAAASGDETLELEFQRTGRVLPVPADEPAAGAGISSSVGKGSSPPLSIAVSCDLIPAVHFYFQFIRYAHSGAYTLNIHTYVVSFTFRIVQL